MFIDIRTDDRNADAFLKWLANWPPEVFKDLPLDVENFLADVDVALVRR